MLINLVVLFFNVLKVNALECVSVINQKCMNRPEYKKTGLYGNIYDFVVDYEAINGVKQIYDMHRYLTKKHNIV